MGRPAPGLWIRSVIPGAPYTTSQVPGLSSSTLLSSYANVGSAHDCQVWRICSGHSY